MLQTAPTNSSNDQSKGIPFNESFDVKKLAADLASVGEVFSSNVNFMGAALDNFVKDLNTMETAATNLAMKFGGMRGFTASIKENLAGAAVSIIELGGSLEDAANIQEGIVKGLQTQTILNQEAYADLYAAGNLVGDGYKTTAETSKEMIKNFTNAGYGLYDVSKQVTGIINQARELGVTTAAVYSQINANIGKLALYNFENGVQGMAQMAAKAASLRIDMASTLGVAEQLFSPEKAIEMAASMQRLGVNVASLLDPYKLMDMARNDPAKLQEEILKATQSLTYFDEKNQKMSILPGAQQTIRELATAMNIPVDQLAKMALNSGDLERKLREIKFSPDFAGDEQSRNMIANMAQLKDGKYVVTFDEMNKQTGQIESVTKEVSQLTKDNKDALVKMNEPAKTAVELQREGNNSLVNINNSIRALKGVVPRQVAASSRITAVEKKAEEYAMPFIRGAGTLVGVNETDKGFLSTDVTKKNVNGLINTLSGEFEGLINGSKNIVQVMTSLGSKANSALNLSNIMTAATNAYDKQRNAQINRGRGGGAGTLDVTKLNDIIQKIGGGANFITPTSSTPIRTTATPNLNLPPNITNRIISQAAQTTTQAQTQSTTGTVPPTELNVNINVNPNDLKSTVMSYLSQNSFTKQIANEIANLNAERDELRGNTSKTKIKVK